MASQVGPVAHNAHRRSAKPKIGVDIDGVLYPFDLAARTLLRLRGVDVNVADDAQYWNHTAEIVGREAWEWIWGPGRRQVFEAAPPYPGAIKAMRRLENDVRIVYVTHRPLDVAHITLRWLAYHKLNPHAVIHASGENKSQYAEGCIAFIEDRAENAREIADATDAEVWVPCRTWNTDVGTMTDVTRPNLRTFTDWKEVTEWVSQRVQDLAGTTSSATPTS